jgi:hypothetical protein
MIGDDVVVGVDVCPGSRDVEDRLEEVGELAAGSKGREGIAERLEVTLELRAILRFTRIEPSAAGEEPEARMAEWGEETEYQDSAIEILCMCFKRCILMLLRYK